MLDKKQLAIKAATRNSAWGKKVVGKLLDPLELGIVAGGDSTCERSGGNHNRSSSSTFDQKGGSHNQNQGGEYTMNCLEQNPIE